MFPHREYGHVAILLDEMAARKVAILDQPNAFGPGLDALRGAFGAESKDKKGDTVIASRLYGSQNTGEQNTMAEQPSFQHRIPKTVINVLTLAQVRACA